MTAPARRRLPPLPRVSKLTLPKPPTPTSDEAALLDVMQSDKAWLDQSKDSACVKLMRLFNKAQGVQVMVMMGRAGMQSRELDATAIDMIRDALADACNFD
jgi:hypothetical protein